MWKIALPFVLLFAAVAASVLSDRPQPKADFTVINRGDVSTLDVQRMSWMQDLRIAATLFETLVVNDVFSRDFAKKPGVAERWEISEDGRTYTFHLRENARWSNGAPVVAEDFRYAWRRAVLPDTVGDYINLYFLIEGAREFYTWRQKALDDFAAAPDAAGSDRGAAARALWEQTRKKFDELVRVDAPDSHTLVVRLVRPTPYFTDVVAFEVFGPVYPPLVERYTRVNPETARLDFESTWTRPPNLVCNGPFMLTVWRFKRDMRLEPNPYYWNKSAIKIRSINIPSIEDPSAAVFAFQTGAADWLSDVVPDFKADLIEAKRQYYREHQALYDSLVSQGLDPVAIDRRMPADPRQNIHVFPAFGTYFFNFNCSARLRDGRENPFHDARVRKAFALAVDKDLICNSIRRTGEPPAVTLIPPDSIAGYKSPAGLAYNPDEARRLLAEAGYPGGRGMIPVSILVNKDFGHDIVAQAMAKMWQETLGVRVVVDQKEIKVFRQDLKNNDFMMSRAGWYGDFSDPTTFLDIHRTGDGNNDRRYSNPVYDGLLDKAREERDAAKRLAILAEAERMLVEEEFPFIPVYRYANIVMFDPHKLSGISPHPRQKQYLFLAEILKDGEGKSVPLEMPPLPLKN